jgi:16S rRNA processing protein RimM
MTANPAAWVLLAHIVRPQGRHGEVLAEIHTDFPESFARRKRLYLRQGEAVREMMLDSHWLHKGRVVLKFNQVNSITEAETLRGCDVVIPREERVPLEDDAVYISDLLGARVIDTRGGGAVDVGEITGVVPEGTAAAMLEVFSPAGEELLIPFVRVYLKKIDLENNRLLMDLPQGLLEAQTAPADLIE